MKAWNPNGDGWLVESDKLGDDWSSWKVVDDECSIFVVLFMLLGVFLCLQVKGA